MYINKFKKKKNRTFIGLLRRVSGVGPSSHFLNLLLSLKGCKLHIGGTSGKEPTC